MHIHLQDIIQHYGYIGIYSSLVLGIVGIPVPDEILMVFCGYLVSTGKLRFVPTLIAAFAGSITGMSFSYLVGRKLGGFILENRKKLAKKISGASAWFEKYGKFAIIIGYFIPGIRYVTAYFSGMTKMPYKKFISFAAVGAAIWATLFISLGLYLGKKWRWYFYYIHRYSKIVLIVIVLIVIMIILYNIFVRRKKPKKMKKRKHLLRKRIAVTAACSQKKKD